MTSCQQTSSTTTIARRRLWPVPGDHEATLITAVLGAMARQRVAAVHLALSLGARLAKLCGRESRMLALALDAQQRLRLQRPLVVVGLGCRSVGVGVVSVVVAVAIVLVIAMDLAGLGSSSVRALSLLLALVLLVLGALGSSSGSELGIAGWPFRDRGRRSAANFEFRQRLT